MARFVAWLVVIGGALLAIGYYGYADVWTVPTDDPRLLVSIEPSLRGGDVVLVERHGPPSLGNVVRCTDPDEPRRFVVGRIVAMGGSDLKIVDQTFINPDSRETSDTACPATTLVNPATGDTVDLSCESREFAGTSYETLNKSDEAATSERPTQLKVPAGRVYLFSDDRYLHLDSRDFGTVPEASCQHISFRLWGANGFSDGSRRFNIVW